MQTCLSDQRGKLQPRPRKASEGRPPAEMLGFRRIPAPPTACFTAHSREVPAPLLLSQVDLTDAAGTWGWTLISVPRSPRSLSQAAAHDSSPPPLHLAPPMPQNPAPNSSQSAAARCCVSHSRSVVIKRSRERHQHLAPPPAGRPRGGLGLGSPAQEQFPPTLSDLLS